ncbi:hypothetical protein [Photorhabdus akhurstii]
MSRHPSKEIPEPLRKLGHSTKIDTIANALNALGKHLELVAI